MPELPEIETIHIELLHNILNKTIKETIIRQQTLRCTIPQNIELSTQNQKILGVHRRAKYILIDLKKGSIIIHLGMSGHIVLINKYITPNKHDHMDIILDDNRILRFTDQRRFGCILWQEKGTVCSTLNKLGPEPLSHNLNGLYLFQKSRNRNTTIKTFLLDQKNISGLGNIYTTEILFYVGIRPNIPARLITYNKYTLLADTIKKILSVAIQHGGTTFRDFINLNNHPGNFQKQLLVYGKHHKHCFRCGLTLSNNKINGRSTIWCQHCQQ